jgi:hypothetical protein
MNFEAYSIRRQREKAATHEASHAVLAIKIGHGCERVEIWPGIQEDGSAPDGICTFREFRSLSRKARIICTLGGPLSERRTGSYINYQSEHDFKEVVKLLRGSGLDYRALLAETEQLLTKYWAEIELLAHELMHRRLLVGGEIIQAMTPWNAHD